MTATPHERNAVLAYVGVQVGDDVVHLQKGCCRARRRGRPRHLGRPLPGESVVSRERAPEPLFARGLQSRDVVLTFHVGLAARVACRELVPISDNAAALLPTAWRLWEQAVEALTTGREAEDFQVVGYGCATAWCRTRPRSPTTISCRRARTPKGAETPRRPAHRKALLGRGAIGGRHL